MALARSIYDTKTQLSRLLKQVRQGKEVVITDRGEPVAKIIPFKDPQTVDERLKYLDERGLLIPARNKTFPQFPVARRPGALARFLKDR